MNVLTPRRRDAQCGLGIERASGQTTKRHNVLLARGQIGEARGAYQLAIACDPHYASAHFNLGNLNCRASEYEHALHNYQVAIGIKPDFADAFVA